MFSRFHTVYKYFFQCTPYYWDIENILPKFYSFAYVYKYAWLGCLFMQTFSSLDTQCLVCVCTYHKSYMQSVLVLVQRIKLEIPLSQRLCLAFYTPIFKSSDTRKSKVYHLRKMVTNLLGRRLYFQFDNKLNFYYEFFLLRIKPGWYEIMEYVDFMRIKNKTQNWKFTLKDENIVT